MTFNNLNLIWLLKYQLFHIYQLSLLILVLFSKIMLINSFINKIFNLVLLIIKVSLIRVYFGIIS